MYYDRVCVCVCVRVCVCTIILPTKPSTLCLMFHTHSLILRVSFPRSPMIPCIQCFMQSASQFPDPQDYCTYSSTQPKFISHISLDQQNIVPPTDFITTCVYRFIVHSDIVTVLEKFRTCFTLLNIKVMVTVAV